MDTDNTERLHNAVMLVDSRKGVQTMARAINTRFSRLVI